jgi:hypothetical protein
MWYRNNFPDYGKITFQFQNPAQYRKEIPAYDVFALGMGFKYI